MTRKEAKATGAGMAQNAAVINPYALAELVVGRKIPWREIPDTQRLLEDILQTPYEELFDPKFEGPLYTGLRLDANLQLQPVRSPLLDIEVRVDLNDLEHPLEPDLSAIKTLADLGPHFDTNEIGRIAVQRAELVGQHQIMLRLRLPDKERWQRLARVLTKDIVATIAFDPQSVGQSKDWTPPNGTWGDAGRFFNEAAEFFDPVQGAVANCYYIAALSAVAWAMPYRITHLTRAVGTTQERFLNMIRFYKPDSGGQLDREIEVTDAVPLSNGNFIYCRSSESGEIWPAVYEKAYAKLKTGITGDHPDITATAWGDCVWATAQLTGGRRFYYDTPSFSADDLWNLVRANSLSYRTFNPMTAWTYSSGEASEKKIIYSDANIVASHCYTILGWAYRNDRKYIILRNPWGYTEATVQTLNDTVWLYDISWWRPINLTAIDGTFALEASAFKTYFAGLGVVK
ncbi:MAG: C2 family cysteine protease [candidate division KSB1 bacterium]|nr:C2 family cysteine protease [candidate division KSB1 bacterium]MDZ7273616.1 C2 family cysteine protease [candidate division KSB1 bacterium]MDZ7286793.1 C2 family cysteine protease [candidate division KSB1 bacterium]MDZ7299850.1 C2 family cysteine protease [candidate division KSB1 bacterium]MDZ7307763.1 C2 family cysteine protease [candidate division KSB1 bacterium]